MGNLEIMLLHDVRILGVPPIPVDAQSSKLLTNQELGPNAKEQYGCHHYYYLFAP